MNNRQKELLHNLLANPADTGSAYAADLQEMVRAYPQSGLLRALYVRASEEKKPVSAGAYFDGAALHKLSFHTDNLLPVTPEQIVLQAGSTAVPTPSAPTSQQQPVADYTPAEPIYYQKDNNSDILTDQPPGFPEVLNVSWLTNPEEEFAADIRTETERNNDTDAHQLVEAAGQAQNEAAKEEIAKPAEEEVKEDTEVPAPEKIESRQINQQEEEFTLPPVISDEPVAPEEALIEHPEEPQAVIAPEEAPVALPVSPVSESPIEDDIFEEITGIEDIEIAQTPADVSAEPVAANEALVETEQAAPENQEIDPATADEAEKLMLGNIAATDYFVFDRAFGDKKTAEEKPEPVQPQFIAQQPEPFVEENTPSPHQDVSKYHDEKMPYTFMWWLDKTRKEHDNLYQPYSKAPVASPVRKPVPNELQQQYLENIFHISSIDELNSDAAKTVEFDMQSKEDRIIQRFISQDPHIHPPVGEKLDNENKAKKSSEDSDQMVTETLAQIYADQMLYPKAIATYQKLMLKYPEKSRYFASRIQNLEKKTN